MYLPNDLNVILTLIRSLKIKNEQFWANEMPMSDVQQDAIQEYRSQIWLLTDMLNGNIYV